MQEGGGLGGRGVGEVPSPNPCAATPPTTPSSTFINYKIG
ncbi:hypothetical protein COCOBI_pt-0460 (chloroplast) [Coccomyxa sp. Obi]|nr:hypothetical protein COCOBI_pt-0460 [Coccomyxa sp. Obi]